MNFEQVANQLKGFKENIILIYAFNATGKTRLSVAYKNATKDQETGRHAGVYYNAFSEDLFIWDNDEGNQGENINLSVLYSSLNKFHSFLTENAVLDKLQMYDPKYKFQFNSYADSENGIESITFFMPGNDQEPIKISRGEERIFVWCFFLALLEVEGWADQQNAHIFIDDPVSSLDDHNIFVTAATIFDLIENQFEKRKIIVTTHHMGIFSILSDWLSKGEKANKFSDPKKGKKFKLFILDRDGDELVLENTRNSVLLYHLRLMQVLEKARKEELLTYHFALLRQVLENIASFLGVGQFGYVLEQIGIEDKNRVATIVNTLSHQKIYYHQSDIMVPDNKKLFNEIFDNLKEKYQFVLHAD